MAYNSINQAEVILWGKTIGFVTWDSRRDLCAFQYEESFAKTPFQLSPFMMPLGQDIFAFPELANGFKGLPSLLVDSLPDKFGQKLINEWLESQNRPKESFSPVEALCYIGSRGMGALEFKPCLSANSYSDKSLDVEKLVELANAVLTNSGKLGANFNEAHYLDDILRVGTSAGGARAKAIIAWNEQTNEVRYGDVKRNDSGFTDWIIKFDGISENKDKESADPNQGFGKIEFTYYQMALAAGITMSECRLMKDRNLHHFMTKRFDRTDNGQKLHMLSLCAMRHYDYNLPRYYSYEDAMITIMQLKMPQTSIEEQYRRMVFNVIARNQDDHTKNISFLMNKKGKWSLSPAYDLTYSYNPAGEWTSKHQMTLNGKSDDFTFDDLVKVANKFFIKTRRRNDIIEEVCDAVSMWAQLAEKNDVDPDHILHISKYHRTELGLSL